MDSGQDNKIIVGKMEPHRLKVVFNFLKTHPKKVLVITGLLLITILAAGIVIYKNKPVENQQTVSSTNDQVNASVPYDNLAQKPKDADSAMLVGELYYSRNMFSDARKAYREAIKFQSDNAEAYVNIALSYEREGNKEQARTNYQKAADIYKSKGDAESEASMAVYIKELDQNYENTSNEE